MKTKQDYTQNRIKTTFLIIALFTLVSFNVTSQNTFTLPDSYQTYKDYNGKEQRNDNDFDNDGITDLAIVCTNTDGVNIVVVYLTSKYIVNQTYSWFPWQSDMTDFEYKNNVLTLSSNFGNGRYGTTLKLKYYPALDNMRLIGYGDSYIGDGNDMNSGAYDKTINLLTNEYEIAGIKRKTNIDLITLSNIEKYFEYLSSVGNNYIGK